MAKIETNVGTFEAQSVNSTKSVERSWLPAAIQDAAGQPPSAYVPSDVPYGRENLGSHRVCGVELVPSAPGYVFDRALPWLMEIAATDRQLASYLTSKGIQMVAGTTKILPPPL